MIETRFAVAAAVPVQMRAPVITRSAARRRGCEQAVAADTKVSAASATTLFARDMSAKIIACRLQRPGLTPLTDDGIVVWRSGPARMEGCMSQPNLGLRLRAELGPDASHELGRAFEEVQNDMLTIAAERFDKRLMSVECNLRQDLTRFESSLHVALAEGLAKIRADVSEARTDVLRWSFLFWIGQFTATITVLGLVLRWAGR
jgi:hypothetical protein